MHIALFWDQTSFLTGNAGVTFNSDAVDGMSLVIENSDQAQGDAQGRWLIRQNGVFYLSQATFVPDNGTKSITGTDLNLSLWAVWNPAAGSPAGSDLDFSGNSPSLTSLMLTEVTAVGFFVEHDTYRDAYNFSISGFDVNGQPVPEPSTWAAGIAGILGVGWVGWRRARRSR